MLRLLWGWGEGREWFAGELGGDLEEGELREQLERGIRGGMEFEMRRARRFWFET